VRVEGRLVRFGRLELDKYHYLDQPETMVEELKECGTRIDLFTFLQRVDETTPKYKYPMEWDNLAVLPVTTFENWWTNQISSLPRNRARQAEKRGVTLREAPFGDTLVRGIWEMYNESPIRQGAAFKHYGKSLEEVRRMSATYLESSVFIGAYMGDKLIGFVKLVADQTWSQANLMHILSMIQYKEKAPTNALIAHSVKVCAERGIRHLVYQNFQYGNKKNDGLSNFKEVNGFKRVDVPRYYAPLTLLGAAAFRMGLHHRLVDRLPESVVNKLLKLRRDWISRKVQPVQEARQETR